jgi:CheY-like chemotaxis protein
MTTSTWSPTAFTGRHIVVADEDPRMVHFVITTLRNDGHAVFHAYDALSATQLAIALEPCDLVISNTGVEGADGIEVIQYLRKRLLPCPSSISPTSAGPRRRSRPSSPRCAILREPFTADDLRVPSGRRWTVVRSSC